MEFVVEEGKRVHEECSTLILPALSIGNVGQLSVDLLVSSTAAERVGYLDDLNLLPCVGNDAYGPLPCGDLALPLEVYESSSTAITLAQQRSPVAKRLLENGLTGEDNVVKMEGIHTFNCPAPAFKRAIGFAENIVERSSPMK
ncbi:hypothetical protein F2Q70_00023011 [Brassica cretica]|uniref:Proteasome assembly chaperone 2 n=1 Tax=Brassica cretica TaxID=69181 RepID=A0A8S9GLS7_BRACR|nr:hypothetical protein F2Q70_00023011 [Brassica cretica]